MSNVYSVYCLHEGDLNDIKYIGQTYRSLNERLYRHKKEKSENACIEKIFDCSNEKNVNQLEKYFISFFKTHVSQGGWNKTWDGHGIKKPYGRVYNRGGTFTHTEETKRIISEKNTGRIFSDEHKKNISLAKKGWQPSDETRRNMRNGQLGRKLPKQHRENISKGQLGNKRGPETSLKLSEAAKKHPYTDNEIMDYYNTLDTSLSHRKRSFMTAEALNIKWVRPDAMVRRIKKRYETS